MEPIEHDNNHCEVCGTSIPMGLVEKLCPRCLLGVNVGEAETTASPPIASVAGEGEFVGSYKILQQIGEGGFGVVYLAEQRDPVTRRVALKVIKPGMDTNEVIARFEAERQALAMMDHPNIAKIFDAGKTERGRPYFAMEFVMGLPITKFCDEQLLSIDQRLSLFCEVCIAVQHAHQKGVIHRDLKPSNIIVGLKDDRAVPKIIDFGIAKATEFRLTDKTLFTRVDQFVGTPMYASPELSSRSSGEVDVRSDIYSLGVILYELLSGKLPFDQKTLSAAGVDEMRRILREEDPPKPSTRVSTSRDDELRAIAKSRNTDPRALGLSIKGGLDWIILKSLDRKRARRYETVNEFRSDIERFQSGQAVNARPPSSYSRAGRFIRRNSTAFAVGLSFILVILGVFIATLWQAVREDNEAERGNIGSEPDQTSVPLESFSGPTVTSAIFNNPENQSVGRTLILPLSDGVELEFQWCPPGEFLMGSPESEPNRRVNETQHMVEISKGFWLAKTEVTQKQWKHVMKTSVKEQLAKALADPTLYDNGDQGTTIRNYLESLWSPPFENIWNKTMQGDEFPMVWVTRYESERFCEEVGKIVSRATKEWVCRLPTEAEWEYACRAGSIGSTYLIDGLAADPDTIAWHKDNLPDQENGYYWYQNCKVAYKKKPNDWGLFDMLGNVAEWCGDSYREDLGRNRLIDPFYRIQGDIRGVIRGAGGGFPREDARCAFRGEQPPVRRTAATGFRPCITPTKDR